MYTVLYVYKKIQGLISVDKSDMWKVTTWKEVHCIIFNNNTVEYKISYTVVYCSNVQ